MRTLGIILLAFGTLSFPLVAAESGPEHPDTDHDNDDIVATATASTPSGTTFAATTGGSHSSSSSGASSTFSQTIDIPTQNVLAALALGNSGFGWGFGGFNGIDSIANIQRSASSNAFANSAFGLDTNDALVLAALGCRFSCSPFGFNTFGGSSLGFNTLGFNSGFGNSFLTSDQIARCVQERALFGNTFASIC